MIGDKKAYQLEEKVNEIHSAIFDIDSAISTLRGMYKDIVAELKDIRYRLHTDEETYQEQLDEYERYERFQDKQRSYFE